MIPRFRCRHSIRIRLLQSLLAVGIVAIALLLAGCPLWERPQARITAFPESGLPPLEVAFDGRLSHSSTGAIVAHAWDFGDNTQGTGISVSHLYAAKGSYTARLTVTDETGRTGSASVTIVVRNLPPLAVMTASPPIQEKTAWIRFDGSASSDPDGDIVDWHWTFGDGHEDWGPRVDHRYEQIGSYTVRLTVVDDSGEAAHAEYRMQIVGCGSC